MSNDFFFRPPPRNDIHRWLFSQTRIAQLKGFSAEYIRDTFKPAMAKMLANGMLRREVTDRDIEQAISNVFRTVGSEALKAEPKPLTYSAETGWCPIASTFSSALDPDLVARALAEKPYGIPPSRGAWTDLFKPKDLLCVGRSASDYFVTTGDKLADVRSGQFIVPNPLRSCLGKTQTGRMTSHCRAATGPRRYIVMESDHGMSVEDQIRILFWVSERTETPLRLIVSSGGKSVHGWFDCEGATEVQIFEWVKSAIKVGFDPRLILPEQFVRFPGGFRPDKQARQSILYVNTK